MDLVAVCGLYPFLCCVLCCRARLHPLDDHSRAILSRSETCCYVSGCLDQLVCELFSRHWFPYYAGMKQVEQTKENIYFLKKLNFFFEVKYPTIYKWVSKHSE